MYVFNKALPIAVQDQLVPTLNMNIKYLLVRMIMIGYLLCFSTALGDCVTVRLTSLLNLELRTPLDDRTPELQDFRENLIVQ